MRSRELHYDSDKLLRSFAYAGVLQALIGLVALLVPPAKELFVSMMFKNTQDPLLNTPWIVERRFFGFANSMLDLFGYGMGILAAATLFLRTKHRYVNLVLFGLLLIPAILNARTGVIMGLIGALFYSFYLLKNLKTVQLVGTLAGVLFLATTVFTVVNTYSPNTISWAVNDVSSFAPDNGGSSNSKGTATVLFSSNFWSMPSPGYLLTGTGHTLYSAAGYKHSDVGYVNDLWRTGLVGIILLYFPFLIFIRNSMRRAATKEGRFILAFFGTSIILFLVKGSIWVYSPGMIVILSLGASLSLKNADAKVTKVKA
jgi:hypothetical protein